MSGQSARPSIPADHRSAHPDIAGIPWWGAVLVAALASAIGFAVDLSSGGKELTGVFATFYAVGCLAAVLAVRQGAVFTAAIQPPLLLFVMVPGAYYLMHSSDIHGIKDLLINCGYPLIERFPLMFFTSAAVLLLAIARWYAGASGRGAAATEKKPAAGDRLSAKLASLLGRAPASDSADRKPRRHSVDRTPRGAPNAATDPAARGARPVRRDGAPSRSRHSRPPDTKCTDPIADGDRPRRRRPRPGEPTPAGEPRRRARASSERDPRRAAPPGERRAAPPGDRRSAPPGDRRERPQPRRHRDEYRPDNHGPDNYRPNNYGPENYGPENYGPENYGPANYGPDDYPPDNYYQPRERRRPTASDSHHPVSRVRYRAPDGTDEQPEYRGRRRDPRDA